MWHYYRIAAIAATLVMLLSACQIAVPAVLAGIAVTAQQMAEQCNAPDAECTGHE